MFISCYSSCCMQQNMSIWVGFNKRNGWVTMPGICSLITQAQTFHSDSTEHYSWSWAYGNQGWGLDSVVIEETTIEFAAPLTLVATDHRERVVYQLSQPLNEVRTGVFFARTINMHAPAPTAFCGVEIDYNYSAIQIAYNLHVKTQKFENMSVYYFN